MGHIPHLYVLPPWEASFLPLTELQHHHLHRVLRLEDHAPVSYTDGRGAVGAGTLGPQGIRRGNESQMPRPSPALTVAVAPPHASDRARFIVEKLGELGVERVLWMISDFGQARAPRTDKSAQWAIGALEQSRGAWLMSIEVDVALRELPLPIWVVHPGGGPLPAPTGDVTLVVGPEGGFSPEELSRADTTVGLGARVLRVETAAVVASALVLHHLGRMNT
ncbi:MAG: 16S rRNA (uracil(1498)-N(3))-methyltransferase [Acidimicrobiia bacterium]|nr:16S rRNA (uracil(1498)-N(3))-methyltransferase [Acidimicrobiia bacterium]